MGKLILGVAAGVTVAIGYPSMKRLLGERAQKAQAIDAAAAAPTGERDDPSRAEAPNARPDEGFLGVILAGEVLDISSKIDGRVSDVFVQVGQSVRKGDPIAKIDVPVLAQELISAESQLRAAEQQYRRRVPLLRSQAISREELEVARTNQ